MDSKRAVIYVRVSTANRTSRGDGFEQNPEVQKVPLRQMIAQRGWTLIRVYSDRMSGAKENRPGLNGLMQAARRGEFDAVVVWRFDRFARSIEQLVLAVAEVRSLGVDFVSCQEALDIVFGAGCAIADVKYKLAQEGWNRPDLYEVVAAASRMNSRMTKYVPKLESGSPAPTSAATAASYWLSRGSRWSPPRERRLSM